MSTNIPGQNLQITKFQTQRTHKHQGPLTVVREHQVNQGHNITARDATVIASEGNLWWRKVSEAIEIRKRHLEINRDGSYNTPVIFIELLLYDNKHLGHMTPDNSSFKC
ncbi:hypothetical protein LSAT2_024945 [Lamellibrachia satsuma]|nr:hypothetical protein LSAT2_024945 [Lamellibrachia satsuma]